MIAIISTVLFSYVMAAGPPSAEAAPLVGDPVHGAALLEKLPPVDGAWANTVSDVDALRAIQDGSGGFPQTGTENPLDAWDVLALIRQRNTALSDLLLGADHVLLGSGKLDDNATGRLRDQAKLTDIASDLRVYGLYKLGSDGLTYVDEKESKKRDQLKKNTKVGYVVFVKLAGFKGGGWEAAFALDKDMKVQKALVRAADGTAPAEAQQAAARLVGKGARGRYEPLPLGGTGKMVGELQQPLSNAYLNAAEAVYMYEVAEKEYFAFD